MSDIGILLPKIIEIGGVERVANILALNLDVDIYTTYVRENIDEHFPGMSEHIVKISNRNDPSLISLVRDFRSMRNSVDLMIYPYPRSIYLSEIRRDIPYLYYIGSIPHHFYLTTEEHSRYLHKMTFRNYVDKMIWKMFVKNLDTQRVIVNSEMIGAIYKDMVGSVPKEVLYPPVDVKQYKCKSSENFYLSVSRFELYKRIDWQIEAFRGTNEKLIIAGDGPLFSEYSKYIEKNGIDNVILLNTISQNELIEYYSRCKAFIFTSYKEHFGMTPLEAMASGKPVLSIRSGGPLEYVVEGVNGFYFDTIEELKSEISTLSDERLQGMKRDCIITAQKFDTSIFIKKFKNILNGIL